MSVKLINIGFGNVISAGRIIAVISPDSAPVRRLVADARTENKLIDATYGRRTRAIVIMDSGHIVLSPILPETVAGRATDGKNTEGEQ